MLAAGLMGALGGCQFFLDGDQVRLCRQTLPVLNEEGARIEAAQPSALDDDGVAIRYRVALPDGGTRERTAVCRFGGAGLALSKNQITSLLSDGVPLNGGELHMLRRFWLETPDAGASDVGSAVAAPALPTGLAIALQHLLSSLPLISTYALLATAYALVYGLIGRINLAFGEFAALGGLGATLGVTLGMAAGWRSALLGVALAAATALFVTVSHALAASRAVFLPLAGRTGQQALVATAGLAIALQEYMRLTQGSGTRWLPPLLNDPLVVARAPDFAVTVTPVALLVSAAATVVAGGVLALLARSPFGRSWRAMADDAGAAELFGVSRRRVYGQTLALACGMAGCSGLFITLFYGGMGYAGGTALGLKALVGAIAGGIGSVPGAMLGGALLGLAETVWSATLPIENRDIFVFSALAALLALKPGGLFGFGELTPRRV